MSRNRASLRYLRRLILLVSLLLLTACQSASTATPVAPAAESRLKVVATTTIVGDVVGEIGHEQIDLSVLLPIGTDPHGFEPAPSDIALMSEADVIFINGLGLEQFLEPLLGNVRSDVPVVSVSTGIQALALQSEHAHEDEEDSHNDERNHQDNGLDPHVWTDPTNVAIWSQNIGQTLSELDPDHAAAFAEAAGRYQQELADLDSWVKARVAAIPLDRRLLVTDHALYGYFANRYGFTQVGTVVPGYSSLSSPSAKEVADLQDSIRRLQVPAVFVGNTVNPTLAQRVAEDTGIQLVFLYTGSLSEPAEDAPTYLAYVRYNVDAIVSALQ